LLFQELSDAIQRLDDAKAVAVSNEQRADKVEADARRAEERHARQMNLQQQEHNSKMSDVCAQLEEAQQQLQQQLAQFVNVRLPCREMCHSMLMH
jgi:Asp-tRNA(Asn)/Glu-tRNA(Gln) amidotransferase A subunit family amidase